MIIIGEKAYLKSYDPKMDQGSNVQSEISKLVKMQNDDKNNTKVQRKENKNTNNDIYKNIKNKASILNKDQRNIQEKISLIQIQEQKVGDMENILKQVRSTYIQAIENGKQEETKQKIKIKKILREVDELNDDYESEKEYIKGDESILSVVDEALNKINYIKNKLAQYKSRLLSLESEVDRNKRDIESTEKSIESYKESEEYISEKIILNPLDFIFIEGSIDSGIIINILI